MAGQRNAGLPAQEYAKITRQTKIMLNFPGSPSGFEQVKGRVFESISCGCLLLERENPRTRDFFEPNKEYIEFKNESELLDKISYFLNNQDKRKEIATNGLSRFNENYTHNHFWDKFFERIKEKE